MLKNKLIELLGGYTSQEYNLLHNLLVENRADILSTQRYMKGVDEMLVKILYKIDNNFADIKTILQSNTFQNHFDMTKKARGWKASWKLTEDQKEAIRNEAGTHEELGKKYGVSRSYIGFIKRGK